MSMQHTLDLVIHNTTLDNMELRRKIMGVLQMTNDLMIVKPLTQSIMADDYSSINAKDMETLINTLLPYYKGEEEIKESETKVIEPVAKVVAATQTNSNEEAYLVLLEENKQILEHMREMEKRMNQMVYAIENLEETKKQLEAENEKYRKLFKITETHKLVTVPAEDANELYFLYKTENKKEHGFGFIVDNKLVMSYYNMAEVK